MSPTRIAISLDRGLPGLGASAGRRTGPHLGIETADRDHLIERLHRLPSILPVFAQELASARRQTAALRIENRGPLEEVRRLRSQPGESSPPQRHHARVVSQDHCCTSRELDGVEG
ncbi:MAG: hypothetical protein WA484_05625 [Solirubrobacteraceae bacterium]